MAGETTVGSIVGYMRLDKTDWDAKIAAAKAQADSLGAHDPNIHIDTNAAEATAELGAVAVAEKAVGDEADHATPKVKKLGDEAKSSGERGSGGLVGILKAIAPILPAVIPLTAGVGALGVGLGGMGLAGILAFGGIKNAMDEGGPLGQQYTTMVEGLQRKLEQLQAVAASGILEGFRSGVDAVNTSMPTLITVVGNLSRDLGGVFSASVQGVLTLVGKLSPLFDAVGAALDRGAVSFQQWADSSSADHLIQYMVDNLPTAISALSGLATTVGHVVQAFAPMGSIGLSSLSMLLQLLSNIPVDQLSQLASAATSAYLAFRLYGGLSAGMDALAGGLRRVGAEAAAAKLAAGGMSIALGGISAIIGIATFAWASWSQGQQQAKQAADDLRNSLDQTTGALTNQSIVVAQKTLADNGAIQAAKDLGISQTDLITGALDPTSAAFGRVKDRMSELTAGSGEYGGAVDQNNADLQIQNENIKKVTSALDGSNKAISEGRDAIKERAAVSNELAGADGRAAAAAAGSAEAEKKAKQAAQERAAQIQQLNAELDAEISKQLQLQGGLTGEAAARLSMIDVLKKNTSSVDLNTAAGVKQRQSIEQAVGPIQAYRDNMIKNGASVKDATKTYEDQAVALLDSIAKTDGANSATYKYAQQLLKVPDSVETKIGTPGADASIQKIRDLKGISVTTNGTKVEIKSSIPQQPDTVAKIKGLKGVAINANGTKVTVDSSMPNYRNVIGQIQSIMQAAHDKDVRIRVFVQQYGKVQDTMSRFGHRGAIEGQANGGIRGAVRHMADGGVDRPAMVMPGGSNILWAESSTEGESYIPWAPQKRARSMQILRETAGAFGQVVIPRSTVASVGGFDAIDRLVAAMNTPHGTTSPASTVSPVTGPTLTPEAIAAAVRSAMHGAAVTIDGKAAGRLLFTHIQDAAIGSTTWVGA